MQFDYRGIFGPDLSHWEGNPNRDQFVDFDQLKRSGSAFMITKAGQGNWIDPSFPYNWKAAKEVGIPRAAYWFLDEFYTGKSQAQTYWQLMKADPGEGPLIVDFEWGSGYGQRLYDFLVELRNQSNYDANRIWIYTGHYYWLEHTPNDLAFRDWFKKFPLWLSWYINDPQYVEIPYPWTKVTLWQKTDHFDGATMGTVTKEVDYNEFNGGLDEFAKHFSIQLPTEGGTKMQYKVVWSQGVNRRSAPKADSTSYTGQSYLYGDVVEVVEDNIPDLLDPTNPGKVWVKFTDGLYGASIFPDSSMTPKVRMEKVIVPSLEPRAFSFKVAGFKEVSGILEPE